MTYQIRAGEGVVESVYTPRGGCKKFFYCKDNEYIAVGPAETGKTIAACWKIHLLALKYPGLQGAIVRKSQKAIYGSVLQTFKRVISGAPIKQYGGERPDMFTYENGSVIWLGGMDNPDKVLSSERDFFYFNQAEELTVDDWEKATTRTTGRGAIMPYTMTFGDCNPSGSRHWIRERAAAGDLTLINTYHTDNPTLFDENGKITEQGERSIGQLSKLTGVRRKRLLEGLWATAEGAVYDMFDTEIHVKSIETNEYPYKMLCIDEGYTNPATIGAIYSDSDGRLHLKEEFYRRGVLRSDLVDEAIRMANAHGARVVIVDAAAAGLIADLKNCGLDAIGHKGGVIEGIHLVQDLLKVQGDGKPRLTVDPGCVNTINEFESYVWKAGTDEPVKDVDHMMDAIRYIVHWLYGSAGARQVEYVEMPTTIGEGW